MQADAPLCKSGLQWRAEEWQPPVIEDQDVWDLRCRFYFLESGRRMPSRGDDVMSPLGRNRRQPFVDRLRRLKLPQPLVAPQVSRQFVKLFGVD